MKSDLFKECAKNRKLVFNYFFKITGYDRELSEDLTQQTFLKIFTYFTKYNMKEKSYLKTWSLKVAKNIYYDYLRRKKPVLECDIETNLDVKFSFDNLVSDINVEAEIINKDLKERMELVFDNLPLNQKELLDILKLHLIENKNYEEISEIKNKSNDSCRAGSCRIKKVLKTKLTETLLF